MGDEIVAAAAGAWARRLFQPGQSGDPAGRRRGSRNKATLAAASLLGSGALGLTRRVVVAALAADMSAMKLCLKRVLPRCHDERRSHSLRRRSPPPATATLATFTNRRRRARVARRQRSPGSLRPSCEPRALPGRRSPAAICCRSRRPAKVLRPVDGADGGRQDNSSKGSYST
jgi:hypothetical protein